MEAQIARYACQYCGKSFDEGRKLGGHVRQAHLDKIRIKRTEIQTILEEINRTPKEEDVKNDNPKEIKCPYDCSSKFSMLDELNKDLHRLESDLTTLRTRTEAQGQIVKELGSDNQALWSDLEQIKRDVKQIKEIVKVHGGRLDDIDKKLEILSALRSEVDENKEKIAKLEDYAKTLNAQIDEEKRQREKSDSSIWDFLEFLVCLGLGLVIIRGFSQQKMVETQAQKELTLEEYVNAKYG